MAHTTGRHHLDIASTVFGKQLTEQSALYHATDVLQAACTHENIPLTADFLRTCFKQGCQSREITRMSMQLALTYGMLMQLIRTAAF